MTIQLVHRDPNAMTAFHYRGSEDEVCLTARYPRLIAWSSTSEGVHYADEYAGDNPPLLSPGDWVVCFGSKMSFYTDAEFQKEFMTASVAEVR